MQFRTELDRLVKITSDECNSKPSQGAAKELARLAKAWKYYRNVPISSFYLEMRAAAYMSNEQSLDYAQDIYRYLKRLQDNSLAALNDPTGLTGRIYACSSDANLRDARSKLDMAVARAGKANDAYLAGRTREAFEQWDLLFDGHFPAYS
jgi:hypothetical protein